MCSQYTVKTRAKDLHKNFQIRVNPHLDKINLRIFPKETAPVIVSDSGPTLVGMQFSLIPSWSKEAQVKFATHNARLETVTEKLAWKIPFQKNHCVVPISGFFESVYDGPFAGNIIQFKPINDNILFAAGIFDVWKDPETAKQLFSFSILTSEPSQFIQENGHDRTPIFLNFENANRWLSLLEKDNEMTSFLKNNLIHPHLEIEIDRPLKPGWEKRK